MEGFSGRPSTRVHSDLRSGSAEGGWPPNWSGPDCPLDTAPIRNGLLHNDKQEGPFTVRKIQHV